MSKTVRVDPIELRMASEHVANASDDYAQTTAGHRDDFADAVQRWRGDVSKTALQETADRWEDHHAAHHQRTVALGDGVAEAGHRFVVADDNSGDALDVSLGL